MTELVMLSLYNVFFSPSQTQTHIEPEQETFSFDKAIMNLHTKLQKVQMEKEVLSDLR